MIITLLDGGMGQELIARSGVTTSLWSVQSLFDDPDLVRQVHTDYFNSGAQIATTNTYSILPDRLEHHQLLDQMDTLQRLACTQAVTARDAHGSGLVAGSLGPQGFSYQPDKCPPAEQAAEVYHQVCNVQKDFVDVFLAETMSSIDQARGALMAMSAQDKPAWIAFSVLDTDGTKLRSGEPVTDIQALIKEFSPEAVLINCSAPEPVSVAVASIKGLAPVTGAYANGFTAISAAFDRVGATVDLLEKRTDLDPVAYTAHAEQWAHDGATIIGGCCEVGPAHIKALKERFHKS